MFSPMCFWLDVSFDQTSLFCFFYLCLDSYFLQRFIDRSDIFFCEFGNEIIFFSCTFIETFKESESCNKSFCVQ